MIFWDFPRFSRFFLRIGLDWRALVESHSPNIQKGTGFVFLFCFWFAKSDFLTVSDFLMIFLLFWILWIFKKKNYRFLFYFIFFWIFFLGIFSKSLRLLLKVTEVTTGHQKWPKMGQSSIISSFFARRTKKALDEGQSPPQELEVGPRSGLYILVPLKWQTLLY